ncbi:MAG: DNA primase [Candidatus Omnitrophica bacterium]|nr:DNA primase [Candidatus Omnitrophota bacterium]MCF7893315.1 DNA primase [Candidatus Omnitrophota bacterium]
MIPEKFIEEIQSRIDIVDLVSEYLPLKKSGRNFKACCPFHSEKTPSFVVSPQKQIFHCFGCGQGGGVFQFLMQAEKINFPEAVEMLAKKLGMPISYQRDKNSQLKNSCYQAAEEASLFYHNILKSKEQEDVLAYLKKRGIAQKTIDTFRLGFAPGRNSLINHMRKKGFTLGTLDKASLVSSAGEKFRDIFCDRILFPIFDIRDRVVGFGGRIWKERKGAPKYINSGESLIYSKRKMLFGLNLAKKEIIKEGYAVVTEGYLDMVVPFMRGVKNIVASLGTSLTQEQIKLLKRFCSKVVLVFDSDNAGEAAMLRTINLLLENQLEVKIVNLPAGEDPDSVVRKKGKDYFLKLVGQSLDFFDYKLKVLNNKFDQKNIEEKSKIAENMLVTLDKISSEIKKYQYISKLARCLELNEEVVLSEYRNKFSKKAGRKDGGQPFFSQNKSYREMPSVTEKILLKAMLENPKIFILMQKNFNGEDFTHPLARKIVNFLFKNYLEKKKTAKELLADIDDRTISGFISQILLEDQIPQDENTIKESLVRMNKKHTDRQKDQLRLKIKNAESEEAREKLEKELMAKYNKVNSEVGDEKKESN